MGKDKSEYQKAWRSDHPEYHKAWRSAHLEACRASGRESMRKYREKYPERVAESYRKWRAANPDRYYPKPGTLEYERALETHRNWRRANPQATYEARKNYYDRGRPAGNPGSRRRWTGNEIAAIMDPAAPPDHELARRLNRSVSAIHMKRHVMGGLPRPKNWKYRDK